MSTFLDTILEEKRKEIVLLKKEGAAVSGGEPVPPRREFLSALDCGDRLGIIAEVKKASPSKGVIRPDFDPVAIAQAYERSGVQAISVLTDEKFFQGSYAFLLQVRETVSLPVLRKDFIIDPVQVEQTAAMGADAMLLIAAALDDVQLRDLHPMTSELEIQPLIEIHNGRELDRVMRLEPQLIGINNRNLSTFVTDVGVTLELVRHIPRDVLVVSESGISIAEQARTLHSAGVRALLIGESLMRRDDPTELVAELRGT
ncbi:MAG: indole-3-glycerol phosphate synthase TrpC [Chitinispirillaceae bacterium]|nr:indole-3-glycerol phosphate synthase TrpC [Chitinispirillaceae bacterium]